MTTANTGSYQVTAWDEHPYSEREGEPKATRASITDTFTGVIEGEGSAEMLMLYTTEMSASFAGHQRVNGSVAGRKGSFVLQVTGIWNAGVAQAEWSVVPGSGTGELAELSGTGGYVSGKDGACDLTLDHNLG
ncbi:MAG TPA: DUF3224 domain-containing protein [Actinocrinis sp.]|nr:DUF3224 domain-containing protein [Actinocrinis sp.]